MKFIRWKVVLGAVRHSVAPLGIDLIMLKRRAVFAWFADGNVRRISPGRGFFYQPCVHPRGEAAVYFGNTEGTVRIWKTDLNTGNTLALTPPDFTALEPSYSWDGKKIVFSSDLGCGQEPIEVQILALDKSLRESVSGKLTKLHIYVMDADGGRLRQITDGDYLDHRPALSPDGTRIVFVSNREGKNDLWITDIGNLSEFRCLGIAGQGLTARRPWFSANAEVIYFWAEDPGRSRDRIYFVNVAGGAVELLPADDRGNTHGPFVDPVSDTLLAHSTRGGQFNIWEFPLQGGEPRPMYPPGIERALHATRSADGVITFDAPERPSVRLRRKRK